MSFSPRDDSNPFCAPHPPTHECGKETIAVLRGLLAEQDYDGRKGKEGERGGDSSKKEEMRKMERGKRPREGGGGGGEADTPTMRKKGSFGGR